MSVRFCRMKASGSPTAAQAAMEITKATVPARSPMPTEMHSAGIMNTATVQITLPMMLKTAR